MTNDILNKAFVVKMILRDVIRDLKNNATRLDDLGRGEWAEKMRGMATEISAFIGEEERNSLTAYAVE